jgi:hypothetical protein
MTRAELLALAARVEKAEGADQALDAEIARAAGHKAHDRGKMGWTVQFNGRGIHHNLPAFTASLDAAASLVPAGWGYELRQGRSGDRKALCRMWNGHGVWTGGTVAATAPLALTAAALRAMAEGAGE